MSRSVALVSVSAVLVFSAFILSGCGEAPLDEAAEDRAELDSSAQTVGDGELIEGRYGIHGDNGEMVRDGETGLEWQRCSLGQSWDGDSCTGNATRYNLDRAQDATQELNDTGGYGGYSDWRIPSIEELRTLVYCASGQPAHFKNDNNVCSDTTGEPTIVKEVFPNTPSLSFWSSSTADGDSSNVWFVDFGNGSATNFDRGARLRVRLVRGG